MWTRDILCYRCGGVAATLIRDPDSGGRGLTLTLNGFLARKATLLSEPGAIGLEDAEDEDLGRWLPANFLGFRCRECGADYCRACWRIDEARYEAGEYVATDGVCPGGHEAIVDA